MNKMKKLLAMILTVAMVMGMSVTAFAANVPDGTQTVNAIVAGVESGATVKAYQIVEGSYNENGLVDYVAVTDEDGNAKVTLVNPKAPTSDEVTTIAKNVAELTYVEMNENEDGSYVGALTAGYWIVLVTAGDGEDDVLTDIYNPMLLGVWYSTSGSSTDMTFDPVSAEDSWELVTTNAYAKSSEIDITKDVDDHEAEVVNDTVEYTVTTNIPSYSAQYNNIIFTITDKINSSLAYVTDAEGNVVLELTVGGNEIDASNYTVHTEDDEFVVTFTPAYLKTLASSTLTDAEREVVLKYSATLTADAIEAAGVNTVTIEYSTSPDDTNEASDTEYVYTFKIDDVLTKTGEDEKADALDGATFTLYAALKADETAYTEDDVLKDGYTTLKINGVETAVRVVDTMTTGTDGDITFSGLDSDVTYYVKETVAPTGYSLNDTVYTITFSNVVENETVWTYDVLVDGVKSTVEVPNTKIADLPSTGGIGTTIFTIGGCAIMIAAAYLFFASRKKEA